MELDDLKIEFYLNNKLYRMNIYYMDSDNYCIRLENNNKEELFSTYIDSDGGEVSGNAEMYQVDSGTDFVAVEKCYEIYNFFVENKMLAKGDRYEN